MKGEEIIARAIRIYGIVQAVGFRPTVSRHAAVWDIKGSVCNKGSYVEIYALGSREAVRGFVGAIREAPPKRAVILKMDVREAPVVPAEGFRIADSEKEKGEIYISPDLAICPQCKKELFDPADRRYLHPFINCTCCGPRMTIMDAVPYDRERTSMKRFPMCPDCEKEYLSPGNRRFDAQPVCCNHCGPTVYLLTGDARGGTLKREPAVFGGEAITEARRALAAGRILAVKGIGGYHLCCDAANPAAVTRLRERKHRPAKPFAVMFRDLETARRECRTDEQIERILDGHQKPIILMKRSGRGRICREAAPGNPRLGGMLPYTPLHLLLFQYEDAVEMTDVLVMTSANLSGAPICREEAQAVRELRGLCDMVLSHSREILLRADDSVMDFYDNEPYMIRRSRGYAPLPFFVKEKEEGQVLALGGELKNTFCIGKNQLYYPSPYIGDMTDLSSLQILKESVTRMEELLECRPRLVACDLHPGYNTVLAAEEMSLPLIKVQHHYAHILSCMAENDYSEQVIGVAFDGTGWGEDGTIWGGEFLLADLEGYTRVGSVEPFDHVGGDAASREGWRIAASCLDGLYGGEGAGIAASLSLCAEKEFRILAAMKKRRINTVRSTSIGRLFDAASALLGICRESTFEGEASCALEYKAEEYAAFPEASGKEGAVPKDRDVKTPGEWAGLIRDFSGREAGRAAHRYLLPTGRLFYKLTRQLLETISLSGRVPPQEAARLSYVFHEEIAGMTAGLCLLLRNDTQINTVALSGGVYQNKLLLQKSIQLLKEEGFRVLRHSLIPPNDGGICLGQARKAMYELNRENSGRNASCV